MKILRFMALSFEDGYYRWAMRERLHGLHPDLPKVLVRRTEIADELRRMFA